MKNLILISSIVFFAFSLQSQIVEDWTSPVSLTDSSSFNSNPVLARIEVSGSDELFMIYEKRGDPAGLCQIWWKNISNPLAEEELLVPGWPNVDYRNPQVLYGNYLVYEHDIYGNYNLGGTEFNENGVMDGGFQLLNTEQGINSFYAPPYYSDRCSWESDGYIISGQIQSSQDTLAFISIDTIDSGDCLEPFSQEQFMAWRKMENNESHLYYSELTWPSFEWSDPDTIIQTNHNINFSPSAASPDFGGGYSLCWEASDKIYFTDIWGSTFYISSPDFPDIEEYYEPTAFNLILLTETFPELYSFVGQTDSVRDIYVSDNIFTGETINLTNDSLVNKNPMLYSGRVNWPYYEVVNIWQTEINGKDVLSYSAAWFLATGGANEGEHFNINISPNPVKDNQNVIIALPANIQIHSVQVYSAAGDFVLDKKINSKTYSCEIEMKNNQPGLYLLKIKTSQGEIIRKLIKK